MYYPIIYSNYMKACPLVRPSKPSLRYNLKVRFSVASTILDQIALPFHLISIKTSNFMFRPRVSSDLPTCLNPKPGGSGPKNGSSCAVAQKCFWAPSSGVWVHTSSENFEN